MQNLGGQTKSNMVFSELAYYSSDYALDFSEGTIGLQHTNKTKISCHFFHMVFILCLSTMYVCHSHMRTSRTTYSTVENHFVFRIVSAKTILERNT